MGSANFGWTDGQQDRGWTDIHWLFYSPLPGFFETGGRQSGEGCSWFQHVSVTVYYCRQWLSRPRPDLSIKGSIFLHLFMLPCYRLCVESEFHTEIFFLWLAGSRLSDSHISSRVWVNECSTPGEWVITIGPSHLLTRVSSSRDPGIPSVAIYSAQPACALCDWDHPLVLTNKYRRQEHNPGIQFGHE